MEPTTDARRYFVTIHAPTAEALAELQRRNLDLVRATSVRAAARLRAAAARAGPEEAGAVPVLPHIEGILSLADVERLVADGYRVTIDKRAPDAEQRPRAVEFDEWLAGMKG